MRRWNGAVDADGYRHRHVDDRAHDAGQQPAQRPLAEREGLGPVPLEQPGGQHAAPDDPEAAADVAERDDRQGRQHADEQPPEDDRLKLTLIHA